MRLPESVDLLAHPEYFIIGSLPDLSRVLLSW